MQSTDTKLIKKLARRIVRRAEHLESTNSINNESFLADIEYCTNWINFTTGKIRKEDS